MARFGGILLEQLGDSVIEYISSLIDNHKHKVDDILGDIITRDILDNELESKSDINHTHEDLNDLINTHTHEDLNDLINTHNHDLRYRKLEDSYSKEEVDSKIVEEIITHNTILKSSVKGILFNDSSTVKKTNNCTIEPSSNVEAVGNIIKTTGSSPYNITFQISRGMLFLGKNMYKIRLNTNANNGKISLKINSVKSFEDTSDKVISNLYTKTLDISSKNEFINIYDVFDMKLINASSVGVEILVEHLNKSEDYSLELDHIIITPAMPGMFI